MSSILRHTRHGGVNIPVICSIIAFKNRAILTPAAKASKGKLQPKSPPKNCLRHSFVSYHVALHRDPGKTALLVSHKDQAILWDHYLGVATGEDAGKYFGIHPR